MFVLTTCTREDMEIELSFHNTHKEAYDAMIEGLKIVTWNENFADNLDKNLGEFIGDNGACVQTQLCGTVRYRIDKVPQTAN